MRARNWILGFAAGSAAMIAVVGTGCGGSENNGTTTPDAAADVTVDHAADTTPDTTPDVSDAAVCAVDADLNNINIDAGADGGGCMMCVKTHCSMAINDCNADCDCKSAFIDFLGCVNMGGSLTTCAFQNLAGINQTILAEFQGCAPPCAATCGVMIPDGGRDGATDGASDAPNEGG